jgi:hypothetical protein
MTYASAIARPRTGSSFQMLKKLKLCRRIEVRGEKRIFKDAAEDQ